MRAQPAPGSNYFEERVGSIGTRLRALRSSHGLGVRELARRTGITPSMLSQIERGSVNPSVGTLFRLAEALQTSTDYFFGEDEPAPNNFVVKPADRARIELSGGIVWERLTPTDEHDFEFIETIYPPGAVSAPEMSQHTGRDYGVILEGRLDITVGFTTYRLEAGESIAFDASLPHSLANPGPGVAKTIWVVLDRHAVH
ncbi:MAG TPA: cupin domain-containing protein [Chloroflexota bacterium]|nr:cupin domain-containing protein [Chloroflexota bacterium]